MYSGISSLTYFLHISSRLVQQSDLYKSSVGMYVEVAEIWFKHFYSYTAHFLFFTLFNEGTYLMEMPICHTTISVR